jgi:peroxiredoxin
MRSLALAALLLTYVGCLPHEKAYDTTPTSQVGSAPPSVGLALGATAPDAELVESGGSKWKLLTGAKHGAVLVIFYKGGWCPSCNMQMHDFSLHYKDYAKRGVSLVGVSVDKPDHATATRTEYSLPFPVLSDPDLVAHKAYKVTEHVSGFGAFMLARMGADLSARSGKDHHDVAIPSLFLIDQKHIVRFRHADPDYSTRPSQA